MLINHTPAPSSFGAILKENLQEKLNGQAKLAESEKAEKAMGTSSDQEARADNPAADEVVETEQLSADAESAPDDDEEPAV